MFKKRMDILQDEIVDSPEWEEVEGDAALPAVGSSEFSAANVTVEEQTVVWDAVDGTGFEGVSSPYFYGGVGVIEFDGSTVDLSDFPALRMAQGEPEGTQLQEEMPEEHIEDTGEEGDLSALILKYAQMDDEEGAAQIEQLPDIQEELPYLFRIEHKEENTEQSCEDQSEEPSDEFTMESELALQKEISGELFEYIQTINSNAEELIRGREEKYRQSKESKVYDPYNLAFNSRYDDTEEVLDSTPEIPMAPKYKLED